MKVLRKLEGGSEQNIVELVLIDGQEYVRKTSTESIVRGEKYFIDRLLEHKVPSIHYIDHERLGKNQILLEYLEGSPTINKVMSLEYAKKWGILMKKVHRITADAILAHNRTDGNMLHMGWYDFLSSYIENAKNIQTQSGENYINKNMGKVLEVIQQLYSYIPSRFSLVHGDLHSENVYVRGNEILLLDNDVDYLYAPPLFDLAVILMEVFPGGTIIPLDEKHKDEPMYLNAFFDGYGHLTDYDQDFIYEFILLRSLIRYPNPYFNRMQQVVLESLNRCGIK